MFARKLAWVALILCCVLSHCLQNHCFSQFSLSSVNFDARCIFDIEASIWPKFQLRYRIRMAYHLWDYKNLIIAMALVKDSCTPFNSKTCKYSQPSFGMELLRNFVLTNKNMVQWSVINHMKEPITLCPFNKYQNMFGRINIYHDKIWWSSVGVVGIHVLAIWPPFVHFIIMFSNILQI